LFTRWVGISPKRFLQFLTKEHARALLDSKVNLLDTTYASGLSGPGRLHDLFVVTEAVTPGEYKHRGEGLMIRYGFHPSPFGGCLVAMTGRGICFLAFTGGSEIESVLAELHSRYQNATLIQDQGGTFALVRQIANFAQGEAGSPLRLHLIGTNFQIKVWEAMLRIPPGKIISYESLANLLSDPQAARAVGNAVANNPVPWLIPCHRVVRKAGDFGKYRYGSARKKAMHAWELAHQQEGEITQ
jgi:AraC family transcriptional regulator of adaptative response/methylated-DNA-[protein]-cysteine methyltransferase